MWGRGSAAPGDLGEILGATTVDAVRLEDGPDRLAEAVRRHLGLIEERRWDRLARAVRTRPALLRRAPRLPWRAVGRIEPIVPGGARQAHPALAEDFAVLERELVPTWAEIELEARRTQNQFWFEQVVLIVGGAAATVMGAWQTALTGHAWPGIVEAVIGGLIAAVALRARELAARERYMESRLKAERLKSEYFRYMARAGDYGAEGAEPERVLRGRVAAIETDPGP
jgi:hypothetical protein